MSNSPRRKFKCEILTPGIYHEEFRTSQSKRRVSSQGKLQPSIIENYENKVRNIFEKQYRETDKLFNKVKPQNQSLSKKDLIEKLVIQMQEHLQEKEKELFDSSHIMDQKRLEKRKSVFYQEQTRLAMLEQMKERFAQQQEKRVVKNVSQSQQVKLQRKKSNLECQLYEQEQIEQGMQEYYKLQRIQKNVDRELSRMGLMESTQTPDKQRKHSRLLINSSQILHTSSIQDKSKSNPKSQNNQNNILRRIKERPLPTQFSTNNSMSTLITYCDQEIAQLKRIDNDISKKKKATTKKYKVIQSDLDAIGFMRFIKSKPK